MIPLMLCHCSSCSMVHSMEWNRCWAVHLLQPQVTVTCQRVPQSPQAKHSVPQLPWEVSSAHRGGTAPALLLSILLPPFPSSSLVFNFPSMGLHKAALSCPGGLGLAASPAQNQQSERGLCCASAGLTPAAHPSPSKHHSLLQAVFYIPLIIAPTPSMPLPGANCSARGDAQRVGAAQD